MLSQNPTIAHRRNNSTNFEVVQGIKLGHRRTMSNTVSDFSAFNIPQCSIKQYPIPRDSLSPEKKEKPKTTKCFSNLLNVSLTYFNQDTEIPLPLFDDGSNFLREQLEKAKSTKAEMETANAKLRVDFNKQKKILSEMQISRKEFEGSILGLSQYSQQLEKIVQKAMSELKFQHNQNEELRVVMLEIERDRNKSHQNTHKSKEDSNRKHQKSKHETEIPVPKPITYKPLSQRGLRSSRDAAKSHG